MDGLLLIKKPKGMTSHDIVKRVRKILKVEKVGHVGTLDPVAEGLLPVCMGKATKLTPFLQELDKTYRGTMVFGVTTSTLDEEGEVVREVDASCLTQKQVEEVFEKFKGKILQTPPAYSAIHWQGRRLYQLARSGVKVEPPPRQVEIYEFKLLNFNPGIHPEVDFELCCSKGTYIRSLCRDIGEILGYGAYQKYLCRIKVGPFRLSEAKDIKEVELIKERGQVEKILYPLSEALPHFPKVVVKKNVEKIIKWGRPLYLDHFLHLPDNLEKGDRVRVCSLDDRLLAIAKSCQSRSHFVKDQIGFKYLRVLI